MELDEYALKAVLRNLSRFRACRATDATLAEKLAWNKRRVQRVLARLAHQGEVTAVTTPPEQRDGGWTRRRTIHLRSHADRAKGALMVANLARERGRTNRFSDEAACGQLLCTPSQFTEWLAAAREAGYVKTWQEDGERVIERVGHFPAVDLPNRYCEEKWAAPSPPQDPRARILKLVTSKRTVTEFGTFVSPTTNAELARCIGGSVSYAKKLTAALIKEGRLHSWKKDGRRHLSTEPPPETARPAESIADLTVKTIMQVLADGPRSMADVAAALRLPSLPAAVRRKARIAGVTVTRFGHLRVLNVGPLPPEYVENVRRRQRQAKAARDAERRQRDLLGIAREELRCIELARELLAGQFWDRHSIALHPGEHQMVRSYALEFAQFVTFERALALYKDMRVAGDVLDATALARQCVERLLAVWLAARRKQAA